MSEPIEKRSLGVASDREPPSQRPRQPLKIEYGRAGKNGEVLLRQHLHGRGKHCQDHLIPMLSESVARLQVPCSIGHILAESLRCTIENRARVPSFTGYAQQFFDKVSQIEREAFGFRP